MIRRLLSTSALLILSTLSAMAMSFIEIGVTSSDMTATLQKELDRASQYSASKVIMLSPGIYHLYRTSATKRVYYASNTTTEHENPDQTKHIGLYLKGVKNLTLMGYGATIVTHGEMTPLLLDSCDNVRIEGLTITSADPTVPEMLVTKVENNSFEAEIIDPLSRYRIDNGKLTWYGEGWEFHNGIAQIYNPDRDVTWRSWYPINTAKKVTELAKNKLRFDYDNAPQVKAGETFQMRDGFRNEVGGLVTRSHNTTFENLWLANPGNFSMLFQFSDGVTIKNCNLEPLPNSHRTNSTFADMVHFSGCKGLVSITNSRFVGAHDDPINVHGTHLKVVEKINPKELKLRFMHGQTFGFEAFAKGDRISLTNPHTLISLGENSVTGARLVSPREMVITLEKPLTAEQNEQAVELVVENITHNPDLLVENCYFGRIPTRGILVSTRGEVKIRYNTFYRMMMSAILIANDAMSWFESGPVTNVEILGNRFIDCAAPVIYIAPENEIDGGPVHRNITLQRNVFETSTTDLVNIKSVDGFNLYRNLIIYSTTKSEKNMPIESFVKARWSKNVKTEGNTVITKELSTPIAIVGSTNQDTKY